MGKVKLPQRAAITLELADDRSRLDSEDPGVVETPTWQPHSAASFLLLQYEADCYVGTYPSKEEREGGRLYAPDMI